MVRFYILGKIMKKELEIRQQLAEERPKNMKHGLIINQKMI